VLGACLVALLGAALLLPTLGGRVIAESDEARFALLARDVVARGAWLDARVSGEVYRNKPPLYPWAVAALGRLTGRVSEATARAPVVAAAIATVILTLLLGRTLHGPRVGLWGALVLLTSYGVFEQAQLALPDMLVTAFTTAALYALWRAVDRGRPPVAFYVFCALAVFTKGPMGLVPVAVGLLWLLAEHGARGMRRLCSLPGVALFAALTALWLAPFLRQGSSTFVQDVVWRDWLAWYVGLSSPRALEHLAVGFLPWTLVLPLALTAACRTARTPALRFTLAGFLVPLALVLLSRNQLARYLLPCYPWAALLVAWWADRAARLPSRLTRVVGAAAAIAAVAVVATMTVVGSSPRRWVPVLSLMMLPAAIGVLLVGAAFAAGLTRGRPAVTIYGATAGMLIALGWGIWPYSEWLNTTYDYPRLGAAIASAAGDSPVAVYATNMTLQIDLYANRDLISVHSVDDVRRVLSSPGHPIVAVDAPTWRDTAQILTPEATIVARIPIAAAPFTLLTKKESQPERRLRAGR